MLLTQYSPDDIVFQHGRLLTEIVKIAAKTRGELTHFDYSKFVLAWNAVQPLKKHALMGCQAALLVKESFEKLTQILNRAQKNDNMMHMVMGLATERCYTGNIGTTTKKVLSTFGEAHKRASALCHLNTMWDTIILINDKACGEVKEHYQLRPIDNLVMATDVGTDLIQDHAYQLIEEKKYQDDEWMYELEQKKDLDKYALYFEGY